MKHHIAIKFIAVLLAAAALLGAVGSAVGIVALAGNDLYSQSVDELYEANMEGTLRQFAVNLAHRYASLNLGGISSFYLDDYYGSYWLYNTFEYGAYFYTIKDEHGNIVETTVEEDMGDAVCYQIPVTDIYYRRVIHDLPGEAETDTGSLPNETISEPATTPSSESVPDPVETVTAVTTPDRLTENYPTTSEEESAEDGVAAASEISEIFEDTYYDYELEQFVEIRYQLIQLPPYTVELYLLEGALPEEQIWSLLRSVWTIRYELFWILGICLVAFGALIVYLCCAAGKKPGREEIRAGGLNRVPLDLHLAGAAGTVVLIIALIANGMYYLLRETSQLLLPVLLFGGMACSLIVVGFLFAFAAQVKTPGSYWWRNSLTGRCLRLIVRLWNWFISLCVWLTKHLPPMVRKLFGWVKKVILWLWNLVKKCVLFAISLLGNFLRWAGRTLNRFLSLLPLTWQWLLAGFVMIFILFLAIFNRHDAELLLLGVGAVIAIILYGAHAFGTLMEGAKRMSSGDLDSKVEEKLLVGSFREFAGDLNALSDVAVVAAQKQMKAERMKTELITNVSHDIKTPLTSIINYVDLMEKPHTPEEQAQYLEVLSRQSQRLKKLIDDLMEMSKASTGNLTVEVTEVDAAEAVNQALGEFADKLEKAQLTPVFRAPETPILMKADGRLAWRVLSNLLSNAVKYALPGTRLYIDLMELEGKVVISLKNISREQLNVSADELLERFVRGDSSRNTEGSGLGLNIAQSLMELQKGQLQLLVDGDLFKVTLVFPSVK